MSLISNIRKRGLADIFSPKKWKIFARYLYLKITGKEYAEMYVPEYLEQIAYRMSRPGCRPCLEGGECTHCGCKSPELFFEKDNECSGLEWFAMMEKDRWEQHKKDLKLKINQDYINQILKHGKIVKF